MNAKLCHQQWVARKTDWPQDVFLQKAPFFGEPTHQTVVGIAIQTQELARILDGVIQDCSGTTVKGMRERIGRMNPLETVLV